MTNDKVDGVIKELFESLLSRYQIDLEATIRCSDSIFDCIDLFHYKCHKTNLNCGGSYINSPYCIKYKK